MLNVMGRFEDILFDLFPSFERFVVTAYTVYTKLQAQAVCRADSLSVNVISD